MTSRDDIRSWLKEGKAQKATHVLVICDTYDHSDYPVFVRPGEDPRAEAKKCTGSMSRVMECYALHLDFETQLSEHRAHHYELPQADSMQRGREVHAYVEKSFGALPPDKDRHGTDIQPNSLYHRLVAKSGKTHGQIQENLQAEYEERQRLASHEAIRPKPGIDENVATHLFIEALIELCQKHNRSIVLDDEASIHALDRFDLDDLRALDPLTRPVPFPEAKGPYR